jgi:hypothetical protein
MAVLYVLQSLEESAGEMPRRGYGLARNGPRFQVRTKRLCLEAKVLRTLPKKVLRTLPKRFGGLSLKAKARI